MKRSRLRISPEKKHQIIQESLCKDAPTTRDIARKYDVRPALLQRWRNKYIKENIRLDDTATSQSGFVELQQSPEPAPKLRAVCFEFEDYAITVSGKPNVHVLDKILAFSNV